MCRNIREGFSMAMKVVFVRTALYLCLLLCGYTSALANNESIQFAEKVNLALRRTAHHLLAANGDSISAIPPVQQPDANTFVITLDHLFDYDTLPVLLQQSFELYHIERGYRVTILDCGRGTVFLGYDLADLSKGKGVPCRGRKQVPGCYNLKVTFEPLKSVAPVSSNWWVLSFGSILALLGFIVWKKRKKELPDTEQPPVTDFQKIRFGVSELDMANLILRNEKVTVNLTYREAKLLKLFVSHTNRVLERDFILKSVWEDEGIIVGRSVDVFVSRLRKLLADDPKVKITAVHGVGYRMDVLP